MTIFLMYFFGQYLLAWFQTQAGESRVVVGLLSIHPGELIEILADKLSAFLQRLRRHLPELHPLSGRAW